LKIGFIGAGRMGRPMLDRLIAAGHDVTLLVRRPQARAAAEADGLTCAGTVAATVRDADAVFVVVLTDEQVRSVCLGLDGAIAAMKPGAALVQHTTCDPAPQNCSPGRERTDRLVHISLKPSSSLS
jgi:3-hydroxyisobutyrate dehydrogenase-like beta-hydroxyacid dehydrogenase